MSEFLDKLNKLEQQLKEEETNGKRTDSTIIANRGNNTRSGGSDSICKAISVGSRTVSTRSSGVLCGKVSQETLTKDTGKEKIMITIEAAMKDLETIEVSEVSDGIKFVRAIKVLLKFLSTMRSNQLLTDADRVNIQKAKANRKPEEKQA